MSSFFRSPDETASCSSSSSSSGDSNEFTQEQCPKRKKASEQDQEQQRHDSHHQASLLGLSGLNRVSTISTDVTNEDLQVRPRPEPTTRNAQYHKDLMIHALLEEKCQREAAEHLAKDKDDPEVQALAALNYQALSRNLADPLDIDPELQSDGMRSTRVAVQQGLRALSQQYMASSSEATPNESRALVSTVLSGTGLVNSFRNLLRSPMGSRLSLPSPKSNAALPAVPTAFHAFMDPHPVLDAPRYSREFHEVCLVGKGGYGKVYKVLHKVDGAHYAIKRIPLSPGRMKKIEEGGVQELDCILEEARTLARLEHRNIVRYHHAWLDFSSATTSTSPTAIVPSDMLLEAPPVATDHILSLNTHHDNEDGQPPPDPTTNLIYDVVFEDSDHDLRRYSDNGTDAEDKSDSIDLCIHYSGKKNRRQSHATLSSMYSKKSSIQGVGEEDDDEIETIPRDSHAFSNESSSIFDPSMFSQSDVPVSHKYRNTLGPLITLNIQMSFHPITLAGYLCSDVRSSPLSSVTPALVIEDVADLRHCFHPRISLQILQKLCKGVQYLHDQGVLHRDLKPANVFLSIFSSKNRQAGCVNIFSCKQCGYGEQEPMYLNPRIGDFGLVTKLAQPDTVQPPILPKAVGTEFYRPSASPGVANEKLDVFALGVVAFELLRKFDTSMERYTLLRELKLENLPSGFATAIGECGADIEALIKGMICADETKRLTCKEVKEKLATIIEALA
ncbi:kinase-like protein [Lepidopterella palustris CBS 459.81]|uniref:Kinase-like protein n=1 Tax=Lepidopterella palustris CBS 459.81 TaxID=1314670 RepID=A0A8E2JL22_9PEZI|nr:kinase-like protein [Lepidopterella palustris CBS 459.81]